MGLAANGVRRSQPMPATVPAMFSSASTTAGVSPSVRPSFRLPNIIACAAILIGLMLLAGGYRSAGGWLIDGQGRPVEHDFVNFYSAGLLVRQGKPAAAYDPDQHREAQTAVVGPQRSAFYPWPYPPTALPAAEVLSRAPYSVSFLLFVALSLSLCAAAAALITGHASGALWVAASSAALFNVILGQNGLFSAALMGFGLLLLPSRPVAAGVAFGLLAFKPHLGLLLPLFLILLAQWRAFASAAATVTATAAASLVAYGPEPWVAFLQQLGRVSHAHVLTEHAAAFKFQSMFGLLRSFDVAADPAMAIHVCVAAAVAVAAARFWVSKSDYALKAAALCTATAMMSPYLFIYDLPLLLIGQAFLIRHVLDRDGRIGGLLWTALLTMNGLVLLFPPAGLPTGFIATLLLGAFVIHQAAPKATSLTTSATARSPC
jgi:arabinofuranan 3-O-arabinosyltransferase